MIACRERSYSLRDPPESLRVAVDACVAAIEIHAVDRAQNQVFTRVVPSRGSDDEVAIEPVVEMVANVIRAWPAGLHADLGTTRGRET